MEMNLNWLIDGMRADKAKNDGGKPISPLYEAFLGTLPVEVMFALVGRFGATIPSGVIPAVLSAGELKALDDEFFEDWFLHTRGVVEKRKLKGRA